MFTTWALYVSDTALVRYKPPLYDVKDAACLTSTSDRAAPARDAATVRRTISDRDGELCHDKGRDSVRVSVS
jgi:hypothetical protein